MLDDESALLDGAQADDGFRRELVETGQAGLDGAGFQHPVAPPEDPRREHPLSWLAWPVAPLGHCFAKPCRAVDGAYDTRNCHNAIADRGAHASVPPRRNAKPWKPTTAGAIAHNEALRASKYLGRAIWRNWSGYHRRSRAETNPLGIMLCITLPDSGCTA